MNTHQRDEQAYYAEQAKAAIKERADQLRAIADRIERMADNGPRTNLRTREGSWALVTADVLFEITWGVANLGTDTLLRRLTECDSNIATAKMEEATR